MNMNNLVFTSKKETIDFLKSVNGLNSDHAEKSFFPAGIYYLSCGEYSKPDFIPRRYKDGWGIYVKFYYYSGTFNTIKSGRIDPETLWERFYSEEDYDYDEDMDEAEAA